jgi:hypothetical protein
MAVILSPFRAWDHVVDCYPLLHRELVKSRYIRGAFVKSFQGSGSFYQPRPSPVATGIYKIQHYVHE